MRLRGRRISATLLPQCRCRTLRCSLAPQWWRGGGGRWRTSPLAACACLPTSSCSPTDRPRPAQPMAAPNCPRGRVLARRRGEVVCFGAGGLPVGYSLRLLRPCAVLLVSRGDVVRAVRSRPLGFRRGCIDPDLQQWGACRKVVPNSVCPAGEGGVRHSFGAAAAAGASMPLWESLCGMSG